MPAGPPQTHVANARTLDGWRESAAEGRRSGREVRGRQFWPSDPVLVRVDSEGQVTVLSHVEDCAWWTREYHKKDDIYPVLDEAEAENDNIRLGSVGALLGSLTGATQSGDSHVNHDKAENTIKSGTPQSHRPQSIMHDAYDLDDWVEWGSRTAMSITGITIFLCWFVVFAYYLLKCRKKRAYARLKREDPVVISI
jgi:hypothetical protein